MVLVVDFMNSVTNVNTSLRVQQTECECPLCGGTREILERPARLMGATYPEDDMWKGDEHLVPCPLCEKMDIWKAREILEAHGYKYEFSWGSEGYNQEHASPDFLFVTKPNGQVIEINFRKGESEELLIPLAEEFNVK